MPATVDTAAHEVKVEGEDILVRICEPGELARKAPAVAGAPKQVVNTPASETQTVEQALNPMPDPTPPAAKDPHAIGAISEDLVREELKKVVDPELFINIVDLGLIYNVDLVPAADRINCKIEMTMTSPMCPAGPQLIANSKQVLGQLPGMGDVEIKIVLDPPWTPDKMTQEARDQLGIF
jgi:metal-sulfur cluster biosynthetic enzyme